MAPLFGESDAMKKVGEDMQKLSEQIAQLKQQLAAKTNEADGLRTQAAQNAGSSVALEDANAQLEVLRNQINELQTKQTAQPSTPAVKLSSAEPAAPAASSTSATAPQSSTATERAPAAAAQPAPATQRGLEVGATAWVTQVGGLPLRLRGGPSLNADVVDRLRPGTQLTLVEGPTFDTGHNWWRINTTDGRQGWVAGDQLVLQPD